MYVRCAIGLGSNLGRRELHLRAAVAAICTHPDISCVAASGLVETPALLPENAPESWNIAYLNQVIAIDTSLAPEALLEWLKTCEVKLGRQSRGHWAPREIDCDLLMYGDVQIESEKLTVPHPQMHKRDFVLQPLAHISPDTNIVGYNKTAAELLDALPVREAKPYVPQVPRIMGIVNVTPDSFSDGMAGADDAARAQASIVSLQRLLADGANIVDIGGESTRPGATPLAPDAEWQRIAPLLAHIATQYPLRDWQVSVDTYHSETALRALEQGVDIINDVSGRADPRMIQAIAAAGASYVAMHSLSIPANPDIILPANANPVEVIVAWAQQMEQQLTGLGLLPHQIILDAGIGFGKTALQSLDLLLHMEDIIRAVPQVRWLVGHSRKSFLKLFTTAEAANRDAATLAFSAMLMECGVDILRVHAVAPHVALAQRWRQYVES